MLDGRLGEPLHFSHPPAVRAKVKAALDQHGSVRKASAATGIPKSTIHDWRSKGGFDNLTDLDATDAEVEIQDEYDQGADGVPVPDLVEPSGPDPNDPQPMDGTMPVKTAPNDGTIGDWRPQTPQALKAFNRYANSLIAGAQPDKALRAAQIIDPEFSLSVKQDTVLFNGLTKFMMSEARLIFAAGPPDYVRSVYDQYAMDRGAVSELSGHLAETMTDAWKEAINTQLTSIGRSPIGGITDPSTLKTIGQAADDQARGIAETWNRDLASQVGQSWIDLSSERGSQMSRQWLDDAASEWIKNRADWKAEQISRTTAAVAYNDGVNEWQSQNNTASQFRITPGSGQCRICQELCAEYGDWVDIARYGGQGAGGLPAHTSCVHSWEFNHDRSSADVQLWTGQDTSGSEEAQTA